MELVKITDLTHQLDIPPRSLRYYEQVEFQTAEGDVILLKIPDDFTNDSPYSDEIENGWFDSITAKEFAQWKHYTIYVYNWMTNFCGISTDFLANAKEHDPQFLPLFEEYECMKIGQFVIQDALEKLKGNFSITLSVLQNKKRRAKIANEIRKFAPMYENFARLINETLVK